MASKEELIKRWTVPPGSAIRDAIWKLLEQYWADAPPPVEKLCSLLAGLPFREEVVEGRDLRGLQFGGVRKMNLALWDFGFAALANLFSCNLDGALFDHAQISGAFVGNSQRNASFRNARFDRCQMSDTVSRNAAFDGANVRNGVIGQDLTHASFVGCKMQGTSFIGVNLAGANFADSHLIGVWFNEAMLSPETNFCGCKMRAVQFDDLRDERGRRLKPSVGYRYAKHDSRTELQTEPRARYQARKVLAHARSLIPYHAASTDDARRLSNIIDGALKELRANPREDWHEHILASVDQADVPTVERLIDEAYKRFY